MKIKILLLCSLGGLFSQACFANYECLSRTFNIQKEVTFRHQVLFNGVLTFGHVGYGETWEEASNKARLQCQQAHPLAQCNLPTLADSCHWQ